MSSTVRTGQLLGHLDRASLSQRFRERFYDPAFQVGNDAIGRLEVIVWEAYVAGRKSPQTTKAGPGFADPDYDLSVEWRETSDRLNAAQAAWNHTATPSRVLVINASARNDGTCPGEITKSWCLSRSVCRVVEAGMETDLLDLSLVTSEYGRTIRPCKG